MRELPEGIPAGTGLTREEIKETRLAQLEKQCQARDVETEEIEEYKQRLSDQIDRAPSVEKLRQNLEIDAFNDFNNLDSQEPTLDELAEQQKLDQFYGASMADKPARNPW